MLLVLFWFIYGSICGIGNLSNLEHLSIIWWDFTEIPTSIWKLTKLTKLHLCYGKLEKFPNEIENLSNLKDYIFDTGLNIQIGTDSVKHTAIIKILD